MEKTYLAITLTSFLWLIAFIIIYIKFNSKIQHQNQQHFSNSENLLNTNNLKVENLLLDKANEYLTIYKKGFDDGKKSKKLEVVVYPWREEIDQSSFWKSKKSLKAGYQHQLYIDGAPSFQPHITVVEEIAHEKLNEQNIKEVFNRIDLILNALPNTDKLAVNVLSNSKDLILALVSQIKTK